MITTALPSAVREVNVPGVTGLEVPLRDVAGAGERARGPVPRPGPPADAWARLDAGGCQERFTQTAMAERHIELYQRIRASKG